MKTHIQPLSLIKSRGFSLVELMVSVVIGMLGIIIMMQIFSNAEGQKRTTTGAGDAQSNAAMAIYAVQRDLRQAGHGFNSINALGCTFTLPAPASRTLTVLAPVVINPPTADVPAGDANTDTLLIIYGNAEGATEGDAFVPSSGTQLEVLNVASYKNGQQIIAAPATPTTGCSLPLAKISSSSGNTVTVSPSTGATSDGVLFSLGSTPKVLAYAIRAGNLTVCDYMTANCGAACTATNGTCSANWVSIFNNVVSLRAQYGRDTTTPMNGVDTWDQSTPAQPSPPDQEKFACLWARASAVRIAIVARNSMLNKEVVTSAAPAWEGSAGAVINLTGRANWQNYRYKLVETTVPLRNIPWMAACN